ncbi:MAG TPA: hypothetical protein VFQ85_18385 [Mycobacteriales bacterium]|nr:hypothetical protein [Mycobacteriales bacterium]
MRPFLLALAVAAAAATAARASASTVCSDVGPVPGYGPVCTVTCALTSRPYVDPTRTPPASLGFQPCMSTDG